MLNCLPPIMGNKPKILILGTMPGGESLRRGEYFAHPQNRFWKILFKYFNMPISDDYCMRIKLLKDNGIALWDTVQSCFRLDSSLDSHIRDAVFNDILKLLQAELSINAVFLNGNLAGKFYIDMLKAVDGCKKKSIDKLIKSSLADTVFLPSTSPANALYTFDKLYGIWSKALDKYLD